MLYVSYSATVMVTALALGTTYGWIHYLCHSAWRPRSRWYKTLWRLHRLHHFKNENYWMGVTMHSAERRRWRCPTLGRVRCWER